MLKGSFSRSVLDRWPKCKKYVMVDVWAKQQNYKDLANQPDSVQEKLYNHMRRRVAKWIEVLPQ